MTKEFSLFLCISLEWSLEGWVSKIEFLKFYIPCCNLLDDDILYPFSVISWVVNFYFSFKCEFMLLFLPPFLSVIKELHDLLNVY